MCIRDRQAIDIEETRATVRKEERIIDTLEPVMNQHRLIINKDVIDWDYNSNPDAAPEHRVLYMLFYQMSRMCREKFAVKHDDRIDALAQGVQYFSDALAISAYETVKLRRQEEFLDDQDAWLDDPQSAVNHMVFGMTLDQKRQARGHSGKKSVPTWV